MDFSQIGLGVDIEEIKRFEKYSINKTHRFIKKIYTSNEIDYCFSNKLSAKHLAVRFCVKEAVYKAFCSIGISDLKYHDVEVINGENRLPKLVFLNPKLKNYDSKISLSHSRENAVASVLIFKK